MFPAPEIELRSQAGEYHAERKDVGQGVMVSKRHFPA